MNTLDYESGASAVVLDRPRCLELLRGACLARVILSVKCIPVAVVVDLSMSGDDMLLATDYESTLSSDVDGQVVSVQADEFNLVSGTGWSVLVTGVAQQVTDPVDLSSARTRIHAWVPGPDQLLIKVSSKLVSGRGFTWNATPRPSEVDGASV